MILRTITNFIEVGLYEERGQKAPYLLRCHVIHTHQDDLLILNHGVELQGKQGLLQVGQCFKRRGILDEFIQLTDTVTELLEFDPDTLEEGRRIRRVFALGWDVG